MSWITENLGAGPWDFTKQPEKCGYVNNPRWTSTPASEVIHNPCGYWPLGTVPLDVNIFGILASGNQDMWGVHYTDDGLEWIGAYQPSGSLGGLAWYNDNLLTLNGEGSGALLREVTPTLALAQTHGAFIPNDVVANNNTTIIHAGDSQHYFILSGGNGSVRLLRLSTTLQRQKRFIPATVVPGTDGHLYVLRSANFNWNDIWKPVTGAFWDSMFARLDDDICDSPTTSWGSDTPYSGYTAGNQLVYGNNALFVVMAQSVSGEYPIRRIHLDTGAIMAVGGTTNISSSLVYGNRLYALRGNTTATVIAYDVDTLSVVTTGSTLPVGRAPSGGLAIVNGELVVLAAPYTGDAGLYRLNPSTLSIIESSTIPNAWGSPQGLFSPGSDYIIMGETDGVAIVQYPSLTAPSETSSSVERATPPYLLFDAHVDVGNTTYVITARSTENVAAVSDYCGTSPVWSMTP